MFRRTRGVEMDEELERWRAHVKDQPPSELDRWRAAVQEPKQKEGENPSFLQSVNRALFPGARDIATSLIGQNEFDFPEIGTITGGADFKERNSGLDFARNEQAMVDILRKRDPNLNVGKDKFDNVVVKFEGKPFYLNKSGLSERDVRDATRDTFIQALPQIGASWLTGGAALPIRAAMQGAAGAVGSGMTDVASGLAGSNQPFDYQAILVSALGAMGGEVAGSLANGIYRRIAHRPSAYIDDTGALTSRGREIMLEAGVDPAHITEPLARAFAERARRLGPEQAGRVTRAEEFGHRLTPGQASGDPARQAFEEAAYRGARGQPARHAITPAIEDMRGGTQPGSPRGSVLEGRDRYIDETAVAPSATRQESADIVNQGLIREHNWHRDYASAAWDVARDDTRRVRVPMRELATLPDTVRTQLRAGDDPVHIVAGLHPAAHEAMELINRAGAGTLDDLATRSGNAVAGNLGVTLEALDSGLRSVLSGLRTDAMSPGDRRAMNRVIGGYETWLDTLEDRALFAGSPDAVAGIRHARNSSRDLFHTFGERAPNARSGTTDRAGQTLERMIHDYPDLTAGEVANWLWGKNKIGDSADAYRVARRLSEILPPGTPEWSALRRGMLQTVLTNAPDSTQLGAQAMAENLSKFVSPSNGRSLAGVLFTDAERARMRRYVVALRETLPDPNSVNRSGTGYEAARAIIDTFAAGQGQPMRFFSNLIINSPNQLRAMRTNPIPVRNSLNQPYASAVPVAGAVAAERLYDEDVPPSR
jgi:hypothetical protein